MKFVKWLSKIGINLEIWNKPDRIEKCQMDR